MTTQSMERQNARLVDIARPMIAAIVVVALASAPCWVGRANLRLVGEMMMFLALATYWNLLAGYTGLVSVGQQAFVGLGGYVLFTAILMAGFHPLSAIPLAPLAGLISACLLAPLLFRLHGAYFAIGTWVAAEVLRLASSQIGALGAGSGISLPSTVLPMISPDRFAREAILYWASIATGLGAIAITYAIACSRWGLALAAVRDSELAAESLGIDIRRTKFGVYLLTGALTALCGALIFLQKLHISPDAAYSINDWTAYVIFIVVIGGLGRLEGPILGTLVFFALRELLSGYGPVYLMIMGAIAIAVMIKAPQGLAGTLAARTGIVFFPTRRSAQSRGAPSNAIQGKKI